MGYLTAAARHTAIKRAQMRFVAKLILKRENLALCKLKNAIERIDTNVAFADIPDEEMEFRKIWLTDLLSVYAKSPLKTFVLIYLSHRNVSTSDRQTISESIVQKILTEAIHYRIKINKIFERELVSKVYQIVIRIDERAIRISDRDLTSMKKFKAKSESRKKSYLPKGS